MINHSFPPLRAGHLPNQRFLSDECREVVEASPPTARHVSPNKEPRQEIIWLVATWYAPHGRWIIESGGYNEEEFAVKRAGWIVNNIAGHTESVVVKVCLGPAVGPTSAR